MRNLARSGMSIGLLWLCGGCAQLTGLDALEAENATESGSPEEAATSGRSLRPEDPESSSASGNEQDGPDSSETRTEDNALSGSSQGADTPASPTSTSATTPADSNGSDEVDESGSSTEQPSAPSPAALELSVATTVAAVTENLAQGGEFLSPGGFRRTWATISDETAPLSPALYTAIAPGNGELVVQGTGFRDWGAGLELYFDDGTPIDLRLYQGLELNIRGTGTIRLTILTRNIREPGFGGTCSGAGCGGHYFQDLTLSEKGEIVRIDFSNLEQPDWAQTLPLELSEVLLIDLQSNVGIAGTASINFALAHFGLVPAAL